MFLKCRMCGGALVTIDEMSGNICSHCILGEGSTCSNAKGELPAQSRPQNNEAILRRKNEEFDSHLNFWQETIEPVKGLIDTADVGAETAADALIHLHSCRLAEFENSVAGLRQHMAQLTAQAEPIRSRLTEIDAVMQQRKHLQDSFGASNPGGADAGLIATVALFALSPERIQLSNFDKQHHVKLLKEEGRHLKAQLQGIDQQYAQCEQQIRQFGADVEARYEQASKQKIAQFASSLDLVHESIAFLEKTRENVFEGSLRFWNFLDPQVSGNREELDFDHPDRDTVFLEKAYVFCVCWGKVSISRLLPGLEAIFMQDKETPILFLLEKFEQEVLATLCLNGMRGTLKSVVVSIPKDAMGRVPFFVRAARPTPGRIYLANPIIEEVQSNEDPIRQANLQTMGRIRKGRISLSEIVLLSDI